MFHLKNETEVKSMDAMVNPPIWHFPRWSECPILVNLRPDMVPQNITLKSNTPLPVILASSTLLTCFSAVQREATFQRATFNTTFCEYLIQLEQYFQLKRIPDN